MTATATPYDPYALIPQPPDGGRWSFKAPSITYAHVTYDTWYDESTDGTGCNCPAPREGQAKYRHPCKHRTATALRVQIDRVAANSAALYHTWALDLLIDEDERLRAVLADADSWLVRGQLGVVGDAILDRLNRREAA